MVQLLGSKHPTSECRSSASRWACGVAGALLASAAACATGVDVSQAELAEICAGDALCMGEVEAGSGGASGSGPVGASGSSGSSPVGTGGSVSNTGGSTGFSGSSGTSGNAGSGGGSAGSGSTTLKPLAVGTCMATSSVVIIYTERGMGKVTDSNATMTLHIENKGPAFDLTALTIRYWFTDDGVGAFTSDIDYAQQANGSTFSKSDVKVTFGQESGSNYAAIGFSAGDSVATNAAVDQVQVRLHTSDYKMFDQSNDFSYQGSAAAVANPNITPYINGTQVGGCVPVP